MCVPKILGEWIAALFPIGLPLQASHCIFLCADVDSFFAKGGMRGAVELLDILTESGKVNESWAASEPPLKQPLRPSPSVPHASLPPLAPPSV